MSDFEVAKNEGDARSRGSTGAKTGEEPSIPTRAIKAAVRGREAAILQGLGIPWRGGQNHIRCPAPGHGDAHPSWRWDDVKACAFCTCTEMQGADIFRVVMTLKGESFEASKLRAADLIGRTDLLRLTRKSASAKDLLNPPADARDDTLARAYLAHRLDVDDAEVVMPATSWVGWSTLPYYDTPATGGAPPVPVGEWPCVVFETVRADGRRHAHRTYVERGGKGKANLGNGRSPKKTATGKNVGGCAVVWGNPENAPRAILCEGIETGAAIAYSFKEHIAAGEIAVAAAISDSGIKAFQPWPGTQRVAVAADRDEDKAPTDAGHRCGEQAAHKFAERHSSAIDVDIAVPGNAGEKADWLDVFLRDGADAVAAGIMSPVNYQPEVAADAADIEPADIVDLDTAKERLADLAERAKDDAGAPFEPDTLRMLSVVRSSDPAEFARLRAELRKVVSMRDLDRELRKHSFRIIEGGAEGEDGATERAGPYKIVNGAICLEKDTRDGHVTVPLSNFDARIVAEEVRDDGAEKTTVFAIEGSLQSGRPLQRADVPADRYSSMNWVAGTWGTAPVIYAGFSAKDHLRAAIQLLSGAAPRRSVFTHLGWRKIDGEWLYLHGAGAIGPRGPNPQVSVSVGDSRLASFTLPVPPHDSELEVAVRASLSLIDLAPPMVSVALMSAIYRAPLGEAANLDLSIFLVGPTGAQKTELTAIAQAHYGADFSGRCLPGNWASTGNALEKLAFLAKDALCVIDDFTPAGTSADVARLHREADRLLRGQGNRAGRGRMRADGGLRPEYFPRGLLVSTGEDVPRGQSLRSRALILELSPRQVDLARLSRAQEQALDGVFAAAMAGYVQWLASRIDELKDWAPNRQRELRTEARKHEVCHDRTPDIIASLMLGWEVFLRFAQEVEAVQEDERAQLQTRVWGALLDAGKTQASHHGAEEPAGRFLSLLASAIASGSVHAADAATNEAPSDAGNWGWHRRPGAVGLGEWQSRGMCIGWVDDDDLYLDPDAAFAGVQRLARDQGSSLTVGPQTLWKRMHEKGMLASRDEGRQRNTTRRTLAGTRRTVIHVRAHAALGSRTGPSGPVSMELKDPADSRADKVGQFPEGNEKPAHGNDPRSLGIPEIGPCGTDGPVVETRVGADDDAFAHDEIEEFRP